MAQNDKIIGMIMALISAIVILGELWWLLLHPLIDDNLLGSFPKTQYLAIALPVYVGTAGVFAIVFWIGITMITTPPPESWDFDDIEEEINENTESESAEK
ncbi:MAG: hypothetical protein OEZ01_01430 [Candidatus Heimdallarchaeota archaeon]|nr:hypothetical protein [Candidatus Heimdallarchaeota archaeon]MDH5644635.1 hypothetical protein [Candidatus Heimdallarchaeota archaeon]